MEQLILTKERTPQSGERYIDQLIVMMLALLLFLLPLIFTTTTCALFEPVKLTLLRTVTVICLGLIVIKSVLFPSSFRADRTVFDLPLFFLALAGLLITAASPVFHTSLWGDLYRYEGYITWLNYLFLFYLASRIVQTEQKERLLILAFISALAFVSIYGLVQFCGFDFIPWNPALVELDRVFSTFGNPVFLGAFLTLAVPVSVGFLYRQKLKMLHFLLLALIPASSLFCLLATQTRAAWLGWVVSLIALSAFCPDIWKQRKREWLLLAMLLLIIIVFFLLLPADRKQTRSKLSAKVLSLTKITDAAGSRLYLWSTTLQMIRDRPLLGFGFDTYRLTFPAYKTPASLKRLKEKALADKTHNDLLQVSVSQGLLGLLFYLWFFIVFLWKNWQLYQKKTRIADKIWLGSCLAAIIGYLFQVQFSFSVISVAPLFWILMGLVYGRLSEKQPRLSRFALYNPLASVNTSVRRALSIVVGLVLLLIVLSAFKIVLADQHARNGLISQNTAAWEQAAASYRLATSYNPDEARYFIQLGEVYVYKFWDSGDSASQQNAVYALKQASKLNPLEKEPFYLLGTLYLRQAKSTDQPQAATEAVRNFRRVTKLEPTDVDAYFSLAAAYVEAKDYNRAIAACEKAVRLDPRFWQAYYALAELYQQKGDLKKADLFRQKAISIIEKGGNY